MKNTRQLHLWIGIITSLFILIEAVTGLLLSEPWLIGSQSHEEGRKMVMSSAAAPAQSSGAVGDDEKSTNTSMAFPQRGDQQSSLMGVIRGLHEGKFAGANLRILVDVTAIGLIVLTVTGLTLSVKTLRAQRIRRKKALMSQHGATLLEK
ncbi:PepSY-associated TM helix domain-containing protein [Brevibacillus brevis]|uniref:PepSY-associated TM helix domain-containing protein n=1 Tax=Brevibacillus brevis TaxID=1393 RepID=A0ABY9T535_BREBE|nr:PepSY-associated TM helix domain-containing protein [Brevibacillus brevis]WNC15205.1 PepSY-associated TM helix domain-containing protein [Brevibacillus brevis]